MTTPVVITIPPFFYPIGNTPATCLTQDLPPGERANILLLGCGDARSILYTTYADASVEPRRFDYTCCDIEPAVLARNILLFTAIVDSNYGSNKQLIWGFYYKLYLENESLEFLQKHASNLGDLATSMENWHNGPYGNLIRFCDSGTLGFVRAVWLSYMPEGPSEKEKIKHRAMVNGRLEKARAFREEREAGVIPSYVRSSAPLVFESARDMNNRKEEFWNNQNTGSQPNPSLVLALADTSMLHYGTDSLLGFHLSPAYAPVVASSPHVPSIKQRDSHHHLTETAQLAFHTWSASFRDTHESVTIRFCAADALMFSYTMQNLTVSNETCANWPRSPYQPGCLDFDHPDYSATKQAPRMFNIIDTSNLMDHVGALNLLPAAVPLLEKNISSTLYTELLAKRHKMIEDILEDMLGGDFSTMAAVLGLFPVGYWTNASAMSDAGECLLDKITSTASGQIFLRQSWKLQLSHNGGSQIGILDKIAFEQKELFLILLKCYQYLFSHEDMADMMRLAMTGSRHRMTAMSLPQYQRPGFAAFLAFIRNRVDVPGWDVLLKTLVCACEGQSQFLVNMNYMQEMYLYNHFFGLDTVDTLLPEELQALNRRHASHQYNDFRSWAEFPPALNITLRVPRSNLNIFTANDDRPPANAFVNGFIESSSGMGQNYFSAVKTCFGTATILGSRSQSDYAVIITPDVAGWGGNADMFVSFWVPTWLLFQGQKPRVGLCLQSTPHTRATFARPLGPQLKIFETDIDCETHVHVTKYGPNGRGYPILHGTTVREDQANARGHGADSIYKTEILAVADSLEATITGLVARVELSDYEMKSALTKPELISLKHDAPCSLSVQIKGKPTRYSIDFPAPIVGSKAQIKADKDKGCVHIAVPTLQRPEKIFPGYMFPIFIELGKPVLWNMPFVKIDSLPVLDCQKRSKLGWLNSHISFAFTARERSLRGTLTNDARLSFKESLFTIYMYATGVQGEKRMRIFGLNHLSNGGVEILMFVSAVRLDPANRTVILDTAILPLRDEIMSNLNPFLCTLGHNLLNIKVDAAEKNLWKEVLPAYIERCRTWTHRKTCEYACPNARVPLSTDLGKRMMCSCGEGKFPKNFIDVPHWDMASKYAVRAAISPPFPLSIVKEIFPANVGYPLPDTGETLGNGARNKGDFECWACGKGQCEDGKELRRCAGCQAAKYCSRSCQRTDWKGHKKVCKK